MTDRLKGCIVTFETDMREDDARGIIDAILHIKGVISVKTNVVGIDDHMARERVRHEIGDKVMRAIYPDWCKLLDSARKA